MTVEGLPALPVLSGQPWQSLNSYSPVTTGLPPTAPKTEGVYAHAIESARRDLLTSSDEAVFLERARILARAEVQYRDLSSGQRQGRVVQDLCRGISAVVAPSDVLLARVRQEIPTGADADLARTRQELFVQAGLPGVVESGSLWIPDWGKLLRLGIGGLLAEVNAVRPRDGAHADYLEGIRLSLLGVSELLRRYAEEARRVGNAVAADCCEAVSFAAPAGFRQALQLFSAFHMVFSCLIGGRDITPGRMDQYLLPFYRADLARGAIRPGEATELLAIAMLLLSQMSGHIATDFQSVKRTPNRHSHYYITIGGVTPEGESAVNELSHLFLEALRLVGYIEPTLSVRWFPEIERGFWEKAVAAIRDRRPVIVYNDRAVLPALTDFGIAEEIARDYAHCACLLCYLPARELPRLRENHNLPASVLLAMTSGRALLSGEQAGPATPPPATFEEFLEAFRAQAAAALQRVVDSYRAHDPRSAAWLPLLARPLFAGHLEEPAATAHLRISEQCVIGLATAIDSVLAIRAVVYERKQLSLEQFADVLRRNFQGEETLRQWLLHRLPGYGCDDPEVLSVAAWVGRMWMEEVRKADEALGGTRVRPAFHSWLYNMELGERTPATPDGRLAGEWLSSDQGPQQGRSHSVTDALHSIACLPHRGTASGGTTVRLSPSHFAGEAGLARLSALMEGYFAQGGLQLHFIFADADTLRDAVAHPERHQDLLVRVTGFSELFVRLLPEVQQEMLRRAEFE